MARHTDGTADTRLRWVLTGCGVVAGIAAWLLFDALPDAGIDPRAHLVLASAAFAFFSILLALVGPAQLVPALPYAAGTAVVLAALVWWASLRHDTVEGFLGLGYPVAAQGLVVLIATPIAAAQLWAPGGWRDYPTLFELSWRIMVRFASALVFVGLFWGLLALSDALLQLVQVGLMSLIRSVEPLAWLLTGGVFGLALAVVHEMRGYLSPYLVLRLLRLFVPVVLAVVVLFLALLPFRGLSGLLGALSAAGTLLSAALGAIVLVTVALDRDPVEEVHTPWLRRCVMALALAIPLLGALALYAIWVRVGQYGWTPARLMAVTVAFVVTGYGLAYGGAVLARTGWAVRIRQVNIVMALLILALCAVWLSPVLVPERISARSQAARFDTGAMPAEDLPLRLLSEAWGRSGQAVLDDLREPPAVAARISDWVDGSAALDPRLTGADLREKLAAALPVQGADLTADMLRSLPEDELRRWLSACARRVTGGPGCLLVLAEFLPGQDVRHGLLFLMDAPQVLGRQALALRDGALTLEGYVVETAAIDAAPLDPGVLEALHRGEGRIGPADHQVLRIGDRTFFPNN